MVKLLHRHNFNHSDKNTVNQFFLITKTDIDLLMLDIEILACGLWTHVSGSISFYLFFFFLLFFSGKILFFSFTLHCVFQRNTRDIRSPIQIRLEAVFRLSHLCWRWGVGEHHNIYHTWHRRRGQRSFRCSASCSKSRGTRVQFGSSVQYRKRCHINRWALE